MDSLRTIVYGDWQQAAQLIDYRTEWLSTVVVERATWDASAPEYLLGETVVAKPGYVWLRFWLLEEEVVVEKYFDDQGNALGYHVPICMPVQRRDDHLETVALTLALWITPNDRMTVLFEKRFEEAVAGGVIAPVEAEHAEFQIREFTTAIARSHFPPALVRNFAIDV
ncbi:MAG: hypothetical protein R3C14_42025 [Caldilineaceae bacterium]